VPWPRPPPVSPRCWTPCEDTTQPSDYTTPIPVAGALEQAAAAANDLHSSAAIAADAIADQPPTIGLRVLRWDTA
jgi:hypothetical protein